MARGGGPPLRALCPGPEFVQHLKRDSYDLLILDWVVPELRGIDVLKKIRQEQDCATPVIFVTQCDSKEDIVNGLRTGADDYMTKPIRRLELLARVSAVVRRMQDGEWREQTVIKLEPYRIDKLNHEILLHEKPVELTQKEYELAVFLFQHVSQIVSRNHLLESVWGTSANINTRTVDTHASRIRNKLQIAAANGWKLTSGL